MPPAAGGIMRIAARIETKAASLTKKTSPYGLFAPLMPFPPKLFIPVFRSFYKTPAFAGRRVPAMRAVYVTARGRTIADPALTTGHIFCINIVTSVSRACQ